MAGVRERLDHGARVALGEDGGDLRPGGHDAVHALQGGSLRVLSVESRDDLDARVLREDRARAILQLLGNRRSGEAAVNDDVALAADGLRDVRRLDLGDLVEIRFDLPRLGMVDDLVEGDDHDARLDGAVDGGVQRARGRCVHEDGLVALLHEAVDRI